MIQRFLFIAFALLSLNACITAKPKVTDKDEQLVELQQQITNMEAAVTASIKTACETNTAALANEIHSDLRKKLKAAERVKKPSKVVKKQCAKFVSDKIILGEIEDVLFKNEGITLKARVDTGAETSSLGIYDLTEFERDGKNWVRFKLKKVKGAPYYEYRIRDDVRIKQRKQDGIEQRFEIKIDIQVGRKKYRKQSFNLANRSHLDHQVLLGRSFLKDIAIVDVSLKNQLSKRK